MPVMQDNEARGQEAGEKRAGRPSLDLLGLTILSACGIFALDLLLPLGVAAGMLYAVLLLATLWAPHRWFAPAVATLTSLLTVLGFFLSAPGTAPWVAVANCILIVFTIWTTTAILLVHKREDDAVRR